MIIYNNEVAKIKRLIQFFVNKLTINILTDFKGFNFIHNYEWIK